MRAFAALRITAVLAAGPKRVAEIARIAGMALTKRRQANLARVGKTPGALAVIAEIAKAPAIGLRQLRQLR